MIKFKGKPWQIKGFIQYIVYVYGAKTTIKELKERIR